MLGLPPVTVLLVGVSDAPGCDDVVVGDVDHGLAIGLGLDFGAANNELP